MTLKDDLIAAKALIDTPEKWGKGRYEPRLGCYCAIGAIRKAVDGDSGRFVGQLSVLWNALPSDWINAAEYNDHPDTTHADIMALFDRAIEAAK